MLRFLRIRRLAVIDAVEVEFDPGLNVLTGETGAGKSILVEAVGLLLGGRASGDLVRTGEDSAIVEAIFERDGQEWLIKREITAQGRSRASINGELATAGALRELASHLIELHGQHEHQTLLNPDTHLAVIDTFGRHAAVLDRVAGASEAMQAARDEVERLRRTLAERSTRHDLVTFQLGELDRADLKAGEDDELGALRTVLASAERVERLCQDSYGALYEQDAAALATLGQVWRRVAELASIDPQFQPYVDARDGIKSQLEDLAFFLRRYTEAIDSSPARLQQVEDRLALVERLKRKHGPALSDVIQKRDLLRRELQDLDHGDEHLTEATARYEAARRAYVTVAQELTAARRTTGTTFARALEQGVAELAMERTRLELRFAEPWPESAWGPHGVDRAELFVSPNPGEDLRPLARIVSGGELSRIMLAIKTLTATTRHGFSSEVQRPASAAAPGLIFDEVDAGIGGRVADVVGRKLHALGSAFQVLCITHLPQIAAYADTHFRIEKAIDHDRTTTSVTRLDERTRVEELGRMLGGSVTDAIRASAREMLRERRGGAKGESKSKGESESRRTRRISP
jgi:DNA repair protein RecN (Recombination protein N)